MWVDANCLSTRNVGNSLLIESTLKYNLKLSMVIISPEIHAVRIRGIETYHRCFFASPVATFNGSSIHTCILNHSQS